jgi:hypothetical protein
MKIKISILVFCLVNIVGCSRRPEIGTVSEADERYKIVGETELHKIEEDLLTHIPVGTDWSVVAEFIDRKLWHHGGRYWVFRTSEDKGVIEDGEVLAILKEVPGWSTNGRPIKEMVPPPKTGSTAKAKILVHVYDRFLSTGLLTVEFVFADGRLKGLEAKIKWDSL